jgi:heptaprenyl diphosphate synthase
MRLGLSNVFYLLALLLFGASEALCVAVLRLFMLFVITGNAFALACSAGGLVCSLPLAIALYKRFERTLSVPAISVAASAAFNFGQLGAVVLMTGEPRLFLYFPILTLAGFFTGYAVGTLAEALRRRLLRFV